MDRHSRNVDESDPSLSSLPYDPVGCSDSGSLVESVGSVEVESRRRRPTTTPEALFRTPRRKVDNNKKSGSQFLQFSKEMRGVPVAAVWEYIRNDRTMANVVPGVIGAFDYLEGDGVTGSVFLAMLSSQYAKPRDDEYAIHKVEVRDDTSRMKAVRCVGGKPLQLYHLYILFMTVVPDEVLGDSSSVLVWRLEYELRNPQCPISDQIKMVYSTTMDLIKDRCVSLHRVDRPLARHAKMAANMMMQRSKMRARQQWQIGPDEQQLERRRKSSVQLVLTLDDGGVDGDGGKYGRPSKSSTVDHLVGKGEEGILEGDGPNKQMARRGAMKKSGVGPLWVKDDEGAIGDGL